MPCSTSDEVAATGLQRIAAGVEYQGSAFRGWQRQGEGLPSVQAAVEAALSQVANHSVQVQCAGRTDAGVHATAQVVHFDTEVFREPRAWVMGANAALPPGVSLTWARPVSADFHARFKACARRYRYVIYNDPIRPASLIQNVTWNHRPLDGGLMQEAAQCLVGTHDFSAFRAAECQAKSPVKTLHHCQVRRRGRLLILDVRASAFLHHMVRNIAGVLMNIGSGQREVGWCQAVLQMRDRSRGGVTAPPYGLYLVAVDYPEHYGIPQVQPGPFFLGVD